MICYRDMTFCTAVCNTLSCPRKFTDEQRRRAREWWADMPGEAPIAFADMSPGCPNWTPAPRGIDHD